MKNNYLISTLCTASVLSACAGGGMDEPHTPVSVPTVAAAAAPVFHADDARAVSLSTGGGKVRLLAAADGKPETAFQTADGRIYRPNAYSDPMVPSSFSPSYRFPTRHAGQGADGGGQWLACCTESARFSYGAATRLESGLRFGAWARADGAAELFAGGLPADAALMPGGSDEAVRGMKGKATYEVVAVRAREGGFATSSYTPKNWQNGSEAAVRSLVTANFNTAKLGGTIVGNSDFGADIVLRDVDIRGNAFSGSAQSDGYAGKVDGRFFGAAHYGYDKTLLKPSGGDIGGIITFDGQSRLNAAFGGSRTAYDPKTDAADLAPVE